MTGLPLLPNVDDIPDFTPVVAILLLGESLVLPIALSFPTAAQHS